MTALFAVVTAPVLIAHQGGWDEAVLIGAPILIIMGLLWLAKRRVDAAHETARADTTGDIARCRLERDGTRHEPSDLTRARFSGVTVQRRSM